jgi:hypothetical protein
LQDPSSHVKGSSGTLTPGIILLSMILALTHPSMDLSSPSLDPPPSLPLDQQSSNETSLAPIPHQHITAQHQPSVDAPSASISHLSPHHCSSNDITRQYVGECLYVLSGSMDQMLRLCLRCCSRDPLESYSQYLPPWFPHHNQLYKGLGIT